MMAPHWNPMATEIAVVLHGRGAVRIVCASTANTSECENKSFRVEEGDVFAVPRFHPMAQMSFDNDSFVFMGFSTSTGRNYPQFLTGKRSVLQTMDREILAVSFNVTNSTISELFSGQEDLILLNCASCAEEEEKIIEEKRIERREEVVRKRENGARENEEEEGRKREEEEARKREEQEEEQGERKERMRKEKHGRKEAAERGQEEARRREEAREMRERQAEEEGKRRQEQAEERKRNGEVQREDQTEQKHGGGGSHAGSRILRKLRKIWYV